MLKRHVIGCSVLLLGSFGLLEGGALNTFPVFSSYGFPHTVDPDVAVSAQATKGRNRALD
jgi:hypothetical protein